MPVPLVVGHQGSSEGVTPGSLEAYEAAVAAGAEMVEVDARRSRDGELLALHDPRVGGRALASLAAADVRAALGRPVASVTDVAALAARTGRLLMVDLKDVGGEVDAVDAVLARIDAGQVVVSTLEDESVARLRRERPALEVGLSIGREWRRPYLRSRLAEAFPAARAGASGARFLAVNRRLVPSGVLRRADRLELPVYLWTVDDDAGLRRHLADRRLRGVITNRPARAVELRAALRR